MTTYITDIKQASTVLADNDIKLITFEHNISYDSDLSQIYYDEFINNASGRNEVQSFENYLVIYGQSVKTTDKHFKVSHLQKMLKSELLALCDNLDIYYYDYDTKKDLIDYLVSVDNEDYYKRHHKNSYYNELEYDYSVAGNRQGDDIKVKIVGNVETFINETYLTNIICNSPMSGNIEISVNGELLEEISIYEFITNEYDYFNKESFIKQLGNYLKGDCFYKTLLLEYLEDNLSDELRYY